MCGSHRSNWRICLNVVPSFLCPPHRRPLPTYSTNCVCCSLSTNHYPNVLLQCSCSIGALCCCSWKFNQTHHPFVNEFGCNAPQSAKQSNDSTYFTLGGALLFSYVYMLTAHSEWITLTSPNWWTYDRDAVQGIYTELHKIFTVVLTSWLRGPCIKKESSSQATAFYEGRIAK